MEDNKLEKNRSEWLLEAVKSFLAAFRFLTIVPYLWNAENDGKYFRKAIYYFPIVGLVIGFSLAFLLGVLTLFTPQIIVVAITLPLLGIVSGFLHLDGLADSFDGLFSSQSKERSLEIMRDSNVGAMGVCGLLFVMLIKFAALTAIPQKYFLTTVLIIPVAGRCSTVVAMALQKYARAEGGLGQLFYSDSCKKAAMFSLLLLMVTGCVFLSVKYTLILTVAMVAMVTCFGWFCKKKIGGATGDTLGATCELTEMLTALVFAVCFYNS